jgi:phage shock protein E
MNKTLWSGIGVLVVVFLGVTLFAQVKPDRVTSSDIKTSVIIDVRSKEEYQADHFPKAINIPLDQLSAHSDQLKAEKRPIIVYCRSGRRSEQAKKSLQAMGISAKNGINQAALNQVR